MKILMILKFPQNDGIDENPHLVSLTTFFVVGLRIRRNFTHFCFITCPDVLSTVRTVGTMTVLPGTSRAAKA